MRLKHELAAGAHDVANRLVTSLRNSNDLPEPCVQDVFPVRSLILSLLSRQDQLDLKVSFTFSLDMEKYSPLRVDSDPISWLFPIVATG